MSNDKKYSPNAPELMGKTYYVAQNDPAASDKNPGSQSQPFATIANAAMVVGQGDVVIIDEGVYREEVLLIRHGHRWRPETKVTFKTVPGKEVYLKGSDVFEAEWKAVGSGTHKAKLPDALFDENVYNPYELSCVIDEPGKVRPAQGPVLPETLGQIYVDGEPLEQLTSEEAVQATLGSFVVSADGQEIVVHFEDGSPPTDQLTELTVRERCFRPQFAGPVYIETMGMVVEHAANPGPFCYCRPLTIRNNPGTGITVRKTFALPIGHNRSPSIMSLPSYKSTNAPTIIASYQHDRGVEGEDATPLAIESDDAGRSWETVGNSEIGGCGYCHGYFLDEEYNLVTRHYVEGDETLFVFSADQGRTWSPPERMGNVKNRVYYRIIKLADGTLLWPYTEENPRGFWSLAVLLGKWRDDLSGVDWEQGGKAAADPMISSQGLDEPAACQLPDGRIFIILRCRNVLSTQDSPGVPSVKRFCISEDGGKTLGDAKVLTYEDGSYVYSGANYPDVWRSSKNGKVYVLINISDHATHQCDPRTTLHIAELDPQTLCVKKDTVAIVETKHEEHDFWVRFSNWSSMEDRYTGNLLLFMNLHLCEYCHVRKGYDYNVYRYEIEFPG